VNIIHALWGSPDSHRLAMVRNGIVQAANALPPPGRYYDLMEAYRVNNNLYTWLSQNRHDEGVRLEALRGIRTPAMRICAFYHSHLWPGDLDESFPLEFPKETGASTGSVEAAVRRVWEWSNWATEKDVCALWLAQHGDLFLRVAQPPERDAVYLERVRPQYVTDVRCERGYVKEIRLDLPLADGEAYPRPSSAPAEDRWHTEHWEKGSGLYRLWVHRYGPDTALSDLGAPVEVLPLEAFGVDFVPFVQAKFEDTGGDRGSSCFEAGLDKFDEINRKATRHSQLMFNHNHPDWKLHRAGADATGRPVPAPKIDADDSGTIAIGDERLFKVPAGWDLDQMVAHLDYAAYQAAIEGEEAAIAADFPEMIWSRLGGATELSGRALEKLLAPAVARCLRARTAADRALQRAHMMALSVGAASGIDGFAFGAGAYEAGALAHTFKPRPVLPRDGVDHAEEEKAEAETDTLLKALGIPLEMILERRGWSAQDIAKIVAEAEKRAEKMAEQLAQRPAAGAPPAFGGQPPQNGAANGFAAGANGRAR
jgi:hypothetical protein